MLEDKEKQTTEGMKREEKTATEEQQTEQEDEFDDKAFEEWLKEEFDKADKEDEEAQAKTEPEDEDEETVPDPEEILGAVAVKLEELERRVQVSEAVAAKAYAMLKWQRFAQAYPDAVAGDFELKDKRVQKVMEKIYEKMMKAPAITGEEPSFEDAYEMALLKIERDFKKKSGARRSGEGPVGRKPTVTEGVSAVSGKQERVAKPTNIQDLVRLGLKEMGESKA